MEGGIFYGHTVTFRSVDGRVNDVADVDNDDDVELADLKTVSTLGVGGFGRVNLVRHIGRDRVYALKILNKRHIKEMNQASG